MNANRCISLLRKTLSPRAPRTPRAPRKTRQRILNCFSWRVWRPWRSWRLNSAMNDSTRAKDVREMLARAAHRLAVVQFHELLHRMLAGGDEDGLAGNDVDRVRSAGG